MNDEKDELDQILKEFRECVERINALVKQAEERIKGKENKEVLGFVLCTCCSHCQKENQTLKSRIVSLEVNLREFGTHQNPACRKASSDYNCLCEFGDAIGDTMTGIRMEQTNIAFERERVKELEAKVAEGKYE